MDIKQVIFSGCMALLLVACSTTENTRNIGTLSQIEAALDNSIKNNQALAGTPPPPDSVNQALLPPVELNLPVQTRIDTEPRFDLKVDRAEAKPFFMGLVDGTHYNMVVHPQVKGQITLDLKNTDVNEVMETVRSVYGYDYEKNKTTYHVFPDAMRTRIFKVNYLDVKRSGSSRLKVSSGQVTQTARGNSSSGSNNSSSNRNSSNDSRETVAASSIDTSNDSDIWKEIRSALDTLVGKDKGRNVVISPQSGVIVVRAMPEELQAVEHYLKTTQTIMQRQVLLEAKVLEVTLNDAFQTGINWAALKNTGSSQGLISQVGGGSIFDGGFSNSSGSTGDLNPGSPTAFNPVTATTTSAFGGMFAAALNIRSNFTAFVELLKTQGDVQVLSSPQVSAMNNQKAVIKVGTDEFFVTDVDSSTDTGTSTTSTQNDVELTPFFSGVALDVIPQISEDNDITLHIHPTVVDVTEKVKDISVSSSTTLSVPLAVSTIRESDTVIRSRNGQVVIIGGLMKNKKGNDVASVPLLGDLPLIGNLFRHTRETVTKSELVILLKPSVIDNDNQWTPHLRRVRDNVGNMNKMIQGTNTTEAAAIP